MKINSKTTIMALAALFAAQVWADAVVSVSCQQRWPWNGKVDINYILAPSEETCPVYSVKFYASIDGKECFELKDLVGDGACGIALGSGAKRVTWDSNASGRAIDTDNMKIGVAAREVTKGAARPGGPLCMGLLLDRAPPGRGRRAHLHALLPVLRAVQLIVLVTVIVLAALPSELLGKPKSDSL